MKTISVREFQKRIRNCVKASQKDRVVVTRHGAPTVLLIGVDGATPSENSPFRRSSFLPFICLYPWPLPIQPISPFRPQSTVHPVHSSGHKLQAASYTKKRTVPALPGA
ncbi:MAG: type II toxin-antitoxin system Phd/YefM family antitoxin [Candidatus Omnitrophica bacterium]|nr:type II toxin-antitoxin system Phd/YefM family antitoxin [Candidatus Omnitrophota bacterium]